MGPSEPAEPSDSAPGDQAPQDMPGAGENTCPVCGGSGKVEDGACPNCLGSGIVIEGIGGA